MWTRSCCRCTRAGLTTGEISAHFAEIYGASVCKDTVSRITDKVVEDMQAWSSRPLQRVYAAVFIDAIMVKVRDGQVGNQPFYAAIGVDLAGHRDVLGLWAGHGGGESAKFWMGVLTDLKNRGVARRVLHRLRRPEGAAGQRERGVPGRDRADLHHPPDPRHLPVRLQAVLGGHRQGPAPDLHRAATADAAWAAFEELEEKWGKAYPAIPKLWRAAWEQFIPFLDYDVEIRKVLCSTNAIESLNARYRRAVNAKGHFPTEQAALKTLYLVTRSLDPKGPRAGTMGHPVEAGPERLRRSPSPTACRRRRTSNHETPVTPFI